MIQEKQLRVLLITTMFPTKRTPSGGTFVTQRVRAHREAGLEVTALALRHTPDRATAAVLSALGKPRDNELLGDDFDDVTYLINPVDLFRAKRGYPGARLLDRAAASVLRRIDGSAFDIVHAHGMYLVPAGAIAQRVSEAIGAPYAVTTHGGDINTVMPSRAHEYARVLDGAAAVAYVSDALRERARALGSRSDRTFVIPNGIDPTTFQPKSTAATSGGPTVAYVGNFLPVKGVDRLPETFHRIAAAVPGVSFVLAGDGPLLPDVQRQMSDLRARFLGRVESGRVAEVMRSADLLVLPSRSEGWPCVVLESHASGTPILGTDVGGSAQAIGDAQFTVPDGDDVAGRLAAVSVDFLLGRITPQPFQERAMEYAWANIARLERDMLQTAIQGAP